MGKYSREEQERIRIAAFDWLRDQEMLHSSFSRAELRSGFKWRGDIVDLIGPMKGIWNPSDFDQTFSITSSQNGPYTDKWLPNGDLEYAYEGNLNGGGSNNKLRQAFFNQTPLIHFEGIGPSEYIARYPVYVVNDLPLNEVFIVNLAGAPNSAASELPGDAITKGYAQRTIQQRLHQKPFRALVLKAYSEKCAICSLQHVDLLDAAHIRPDSDSASSTSVTNGMALCKIHHAAYDRDILSVAPTYEVVVNNRILLEKDGPMLKHGIQEMHGVSINLPNRLSDRPDRDLLDERYQKFLLNA